MSYRSEQETLLALIARVEGATGPDRAIDAEAALALGWTYLTDFPGPCWRPPMPPGTSNWMHAELPAFTSSVDAAMTAVPPGMLCRVATYGEADIIGEDEKHKSSRTKWTEGEANGDDGVNKAARALTAASLKARLP